MVKNARAGHDYLANLCRSLIQNIRITIRPILITIGIALIWVLDSQVAHKALIGKACRVIRALKVKGLFVQGDSIFTFGYGEGNYGTGSSK